MYPNQPRALFIATPLLTRLQRCIMHSRHAQLVPGFPARRLFALLETDADVRGALASLSLHVDPATVQVLSGEQGIRALDISGKARGFRGRCLRAVQDLAFARGRLEEHECHLRRGGHLLLIPTHEWAHCEQLGEVLTHWHAHGLIWFARYSVVDVTPRYRAATA
jgi:hypothetical protein